MGQNDDFAERLERIRPVTRNLVESIMLDAWPNHTAIVDFGIDSQKHYEAIYYLVREGEVTPEMLDAVLGNGPALTAMARYSPSNPHKEIAFETSWDMLRGDGRSLEALQPDRDTELER